MPRVPSYDSFQVSANTTQLPQVGGPMAQAPDMPDVAGRQAQQMGQGLQNLGANISAIENDVQQRANALRVDDALNQADAERLRLTFDKDEGFVNQKGRNALERQSGKPLADEYQETLQKRLAAISAGLGSDAQRQAFSARSRSITTQFYGSALKHENEQHIEWENSVDESTVKNRMADIGVNFSNPAAVSEAINGKTDEQGNVISKGIKQAVAEIGKRNGKPAEWVEATTKSYIADAHKDVVMRMMDTNPIGAEDYLNKNMEAIGGNVTALQRTLRPAVDRARGEAHGSKIYQKGGPVSADADNVIDWVIKIEGGYVANDAGKGETNLGINKTANPDIDVKNLTADQARAIYKERYWNGIGADSLPKEIRAIAFDAAVNQGVSTANRLVAQANGDPNKLIELRRAEYARLIEANPSKFKKYEKSWNNRLDELQGLAASGGDRSLSGMLKEAEQIPDREQRAVATSVIKHSFQIDELAKKEAYETTFNKAQDAAFSKPGGWREIPPTVWAEIKPEDREKLRSGLPKSSDPDTKLMLMENSELWKAGQIEKYRSLLSESDYQHFHSRANGPLGDEKIRAAKIDSEQFDKGMLDAGLENVLNSKKNTKEQAMLIDLRAKYEQVIDAEQHAKGRSLGLDEKNALLIRLLKPVKVEMVRTGSLFGLFDGQSTPAEMRAFQVKSPGNIQIPQASRTAIEADFAKRGIKSSPERILNAYLASEESKQ